ncbi:MAG TPA: YciI family protein [Ktedonobacterales bacterium]|nr:YciI family protein [Ktedonobacterales bacterium]
MKYALLLYANPSQAPRYTSEEATAARQSWFDLLAEMKASQVYLSNYGLAPVTDATTVRVRHGETVTTKGPFAETPEHLGGYFLLDCKDLEEAIGWAAKIPYAQNGTIEVRPVIAYT